MPHLEKRTPTHGWRRRPLTGLGSPPGEADLSAARSWPAPVVSVADLTNSALPWPPLGWQGNMFGHFPPPRAPPKIENFPQTCFSHRFVCPFGYSVFIESLSMTLACEDVRAPRSDVSKVPRVRFVLPYVLFWTTVSRMGILEYKNRNLSAL